MCWQSCVKQNRSWKNSLSWESYGYSFWSTSSLWKDCWENNSGWEIILVENLALVKFSSGGEFILFIEKLKIGKGRGRQVIAVARTADMVLMMLDATKSEKQR